VRLNFGDAQTVDGLAEGAEVEQIYVRATHHGRGLGGRLLRHAVDLARDQGSAFVWLGVWEDNAKAIAVYERHGFVTFGDHVFMFGDEPQRDLLMRLDVWCDVGTEETSMTPTAPCAAHPPSAPQSRAASGVTSPVCRRAAS
jgi:hypothetical protein